MSQLIIYKSCIIEVFICCEQPGDVDCLTYYVSVELPEDKGCVDTKPLSTKDAALYEGIQIAEKWRLQP